MAGITLTTPLADVPGVTRDRAEAFEALGLRNVGQLVAHLPHRHQKEHAETPIAELAENAVVSASGEVTAVRVAGFGRKKRFEAVLHDGSGRLDLVWFNMAYLAKRIGAGMTLRVQGKSQRRSGGLQIVNARWEIVEDEAPGDLVESDDRLRPIYPASERLDSRSIEEVVQRVLGPALAEIEDHLDADYRREHELPELAAAYRYMHAPESEHQPIEARRRLAYDELLMLQLAVHLKRAQRRRELVAPRLELTDDIDERIRGRLPFELTEAQDRVVRAIAADLAQDLPANRLVQGDVGSGKTVVALHAMLLAVAHGHQAAMMAPTALLAEQHAASIEDMLRGTSVRIALLTGANTPAERASLAARIEEGEVDLVIGTHALLTESVRFQSLAVAVIDEQHRFGVRQRAVIREKSSDPADDGRLPTPHTIVMTATPIPRTLAMTLFGDLDVSTIDALPPGRTPITTKFVGLEKRGDVYGWLRTKLEKGERAYVVVPTIDDTNEDASLREVMRDLESGPLEGLRIAAVHGRLKRDTRAHVMGRFRSGLIDCLVATTVIEVGVDVPEATVIVIESAERFGLAQLHQLRGRVGRGEKASVCVLIGEPTTEEGRARLEAMVASSSGFELAEKDLQIRGPGELFGSRQSGLPPLKVADLFRDRQLLEMARRDAAAWIDRSPELRGDTESLVRRRVLKLYGEAFGLADIG
ncbi:MAG: ATP-dependent DNA helicase RecG [Planctomycetota bacterium]